MSKYMFFLPRFHTNAVPWARVLTNAGHAVEIHCVIRGTTEDHSLVQPRIHEQCDLSRRLGGNAQDDRLLFPSYRHVHSAIAQAKPDIVVVRGLTRWFMRMAAAAALVQGRRLVVYDQEEQSPRLSTTWLRRALCRVVGVRHFTPKIGTDGLRDSWGSAMFVPFGNPFRTGMPPPRQPLLPLGPPRILMVSKYRPRKRHEDLLRALGRLTDTHRFSLTFCGEEVGEQDTSLCRNLEKLAHELGLEGRVAFRNNVPHHAMADLYSEHDVFVLPAVNEPAAISPLEAAWCGCAVLIASDSGTRSYIPADSAYEFAPGDVAGLAAVLGRMLESPASVARAQDECHRWISDLAGDEVVLERFEQLLKRPQ